MSDANDPPGPLSVYRAFEVQFDSSTDVAGGHLAGRVEHVVSGQAAPFHSLEALLTFIGEQLSAGHRVAGGGEP
jgi:hypothetical protein